MINPQDERRREAQAVRDAIDKAISNPCQVNREAADKAASDFEQKHKCAWNWFVQSDRREGRVL